MHDPTKFKFSETFNNSSGKTSGSGFIGVYLGLIGGVAFLAGVFGYFFEVDKTIEFLGEVLKLVAASTILLGVRKVGEHTIDYKTKKVNQEASIPVAKPKDPVEFDKG